MFSGYLVISVAGKHGKEKVFVAISSGQWAQWPDMLRPTIKGVAIVLCAFVLVGVAAGQAKLSNPADYRRYIDPLLEVKEFGSRYVEDGAADSTVLFPSTKRNPYERPVAAVIDLFKLHSRSFPILIDCLSDERVTNMEFDGNNITKPMKVPVGYVCLDMLMAITWGKPVSDPECSADGFGACMNYGYYFRPDDYTNCWKTKCDPRPWIRVVQRNWRRQFLAHHLRFFNPYNLMNVEEFKDLETPKRHSAAKHH